MNVLITGAASRLGRAIAAELAADHRLRLMDSVPVEPCDNSEFIRGDLVDPEAARQAVRGMDAIVHTGEPPTELPDDELEREQRLLDYATRGTHVLFSAGVEAGIRRFVYGSSLEIFRAYPDDIYISEMWKPLPSPEIKSMSRYLGELVGREFARDYRVGVTALRLGRLVLEEEVEDQEPDLMWVDIRDAARAFVCALQRDTGAEVQWIRRWGLFHICAAIRNGKYLIEPARGMGYSPQHDFARHWSV